MSDTEIAKGPPADKAKPEGAPQAPQAPSPPPVSAESFQINEKELLDSFDEILKEFATELKEIEEKGVQEETDNKEHQAFLEENWTPTFENINDLFTRKWQEKKWKGVTEAAVFTAKHILKPAQLKATVKEKLLPKLKSIPSAIVPALKTFPIKLKAWAAERDPAVWRRRALRGIPFWFLVVGGIYSAKHWKQWFPEETYTDIEEMLTHVKLVDLTDQKRPVDHLFSVNSVLSRLKKSRSMYRLVQVDLVIECDTLLTMKEMNTPSTVNELRNQIASYMSELTYEEVSGVENKKKLKEHLVGIAQKLAPPNGKILAVYFSKWVFSPMPPSRPARKR